MKLDKEGYLGMGALSHDQSEHLGKDLGRQYQRATRTHLTSLEKAMDRTERRRNARAIMADGRGRNYRMLVDAGTLEKIYHGKVKHPLAGSVPWKAQRALPLPTR